MIPRPRRSRRAAARRRSAHFLQRRTLASRLAEREAVAHIVRQRLLHQLQGHEIGADRPPNRVHQQPRPGLVKDLRKRLERLDEDADLMIDNNDRYQMVIVGGSAFILLGKLTRATHDIDALSVPKELYSLLGKYDINTDVEAYIDNFPYNFQDRLQPLPFGGTKVQFYTPSLEDLVIAKLCSFRDTDKADVESEAVRNSLDWDLLEHLATDEDELKASILNDWRYRDFYIRYQEYVERWRPCES